MVGPNQERTFTIDISSNEFCEGSEVMDFDLFRIRAYSPAMIAVEKYRALCQQSDRYELRPRKAPMSTSTSSSSRSGLYSPRGWWTRQAESKAESFIPWAR